MASAAGVPLALPTLAPFASSALLSDFLLSVAPSGGVEVRGGVATGGVFSAFAAFVMAALVIIELYASSLAPMMMVEGAREAGILKWTWIFCLRTSFSPICYCWSRNRNINSSLFPK
jgi:hypothetical protein